MRSHITRALIERKGFSAVAVEDSVIRLVKEGGVWKVDGVTLGVE